MSAVAEKYRYNRDEIRSLTLYQLHILAQGYEATEREGRYRQMRPEARNKAREIAARHGGEF